MKYMILLMLKATPRWWVMSKDYRFNMFNRFFYPLLASYTDQIDVKVFNAEAFHTQVSDFIVLETIDLDKYYKFLQELKSSRLFTGEYFEMQDIMMGTENGFKEYAQNHVKEKAMSMN